VFARNGQVTMTHKPIRVIALAIVQHEGSLLVFRADDYVKRSYFYRPLGGGVEYGERGSEAVVRELREELGAELCDVRYLGTLENIFTLNGYLGHEIVLLYRADLADRTLYEREELDVVEADGTHLTGLWVSLAECESGALRLVPEALLDFLRTSALNL
jgi:ADP-ribose pyrophosphatase YjhB (NUDIX family)